MLIRLRPVDTKPDFSVSHFFSLQRPRLERRSGQFGGGRPNEVLECPYAGTFGWITMGQVLEEPEIEGFIRDGYLVVREAIPTELAEECRLSAAQQLGIDLASPNTWRRPVVRGVPTGECFKQAANAPRLLEAIAQLVEPDAWQARPHLGVVEHHDEDHVAAGGELRGCRRHMGPLPERRGGLLTEVGYRHRESGADEGGGEAAAHVTEPDDPDPQRGRRPVVLALRHLAQPPDRQPSFADIRRDA